MSAGTGTESLTLDNFDAPGNRNKHYILTSPSSLRACARLGFKPIELLPKSYSEFKEQLQWADMSHFQLLEAYMDYESQRERKLMAAKEERCRLKQTKLLFERPKSDQQILESAHTHLITKLLQVKHDVQEQLNKELKHKEAKTRLQEERLRFEQSKRNKVINDILEKERAIQAIEQKHKSAEERYDLICARKENDLRKSAKLRLFRSQECKLAAHNLEVSLEKWRNEVDMRCIEARERAHQIVQQANEEKSTKLRQVHQKRVAAHVACRATIKKKYQAQLEDWELKIENWKEKVDDMTRQKTAEIEKSRALACYTAMLRAKFREYTSENSPRYKQNDIQLLASVTVVAEKAMTVTRKYS